MSAATASITDGSRTNFTNADDSRDPNKSGQSQAQCTPIPLPALATQRIIQGNGTNVGTVISLQCPAKYKLVGSELMCVMDTNSTHWVGETYCKPLSPYEEYGFHVAVMASIVSSAIICFMSVAFISCCLLECMKKDKKKKEERELWQLAEDAQYQENNRSRDNHKGRNNNNNTQEKVLSYWDTCNSAVYDNMQVCRCHQQFAYGPGHTYGHSPLLSALPGHEYDQPLLRQNPEPEQISGPPPQYFGPPQSSCQTMSQGLVQISEARPGLVWQYEEQQSSFSGVTPSTTDESNTRSTNPAKDFSIRIISV